MLVPENLREITLHSSTTDFASWNIIADRKERRDSLRIVRNTPAPIPDSGLTLVLDRVRPDVRYGARPALVGLRYGNLKNEQGDQLSGGEQQRLDLANCKITRLSAGWIIDNHAPPSWSRSSTGMINLFGHCHYVLPSDPREKTTLLMKSITLLDLPREAVSSQNVKLAGHVKCYVDSPPAAAADWSGEISIQARAVLAEWKVFPEALKRAATRLDVFLDGISFAGQ